MAQCVQFLFKIFFENYVFCFFPTSIYCNDEILKFSSRAIDFEQVNHKENSSKPCLVGILIDFAIIPSRGYIRQRKPIFFDLWLENYKINVQLSCMTLTLKWHVMV